VNELNNASQVAFYYYYYHANISAASFGFGFGSVNLLTGLPKIFRLTSQRRAVQGGLYSEDVTLAPVERINASRSVLCTFR